MPAIPGGVAGLLPVVTQLPDGARVRLSPLPGSRLQTPVKFQTSSACRAPICKRKIYGCPQLVTICKREICACPQFVCAGRKSCELCVDASCAKTRANTFANALAVRRICNKVSRLHADITKRDRDVSYPFFANGMPGYGNPLYDAAVFADVVFFKQHSLNRAANCPPWLPETALALVHFAYSRCYNRRTQLCDLCISFLINKIRGKNND